MKTVKKLTIATLITIMITACGGTSTSDADRQNNNEQQGAAHENGTFQYPDNFKNFENFKMTAYTAVPVEHDAEMIVLPLTILATFKADLMAETNIEENPTIVKHSHCERGSALPHNLVHIDEPFEYAYFSGGFTYKDSHSVMMELVGDTPAECDDGGYRDGTISYDHNDEAHTNASFGEGSSAMISGDTGYLGSLQYTSNANTTLLTSSSMRIFKIPDHDQETYIKTTNYVKYDDVTYKNFRYEIGKEPNIYAKTTYTLSWEENNIPFTIEVEKYISETKHAFTYHLYEESNPTGHFVRAQIDVTVSADGSRAGTMTYNKEGHQEQSSF